MCGKFRVPEPAFQKSAIDFHKINVRQFNLPVSKQVVVGHTR
jgi:hypothetical protein